MRTRAGALGHLGNDVRVELASQSKARLPTSDEWPKSHKSLCQESSPIERENLKALSAAKIKQQMAKHLA